MSLYFETGPQVVTADQELTHLTLVLTFQADATAAFVSVTKGASTNADREPGRLAEAREGVGWALGLFIQQLSFSFAYSHNLSMTAD